MALRRWSTGRSIFCWIEIALLEPWGERLRRCFFTMEVHEGTHKLSFRIFKGI